MNHVKKNYTNKMNNKKTVLLIIVFLIVVCLFAFGRIAGNDFINFDDTGFLLENKHIQSGFNVESVIWAFSTIEHNYWIPLTWLSHILDWSFFGSSAGGHHTVSLLLHIGTVMFLFLFLYKSTGNIWPAAFASALFAIHPLRVESVAWASERKDVLSMFFGIATLYAYTFYVESNKLSKYFFCLILFFFALMSKPTMVTLPFVLMLLDYWPLERWHTASSTPHEKRYKLLGKLVWEKTPFILLTIATCIITYWAQKTVGSVSSASLLPFGTKIFNAIASYVGYLEKTLWPVNLAIFYPYDFSISLLKVFMLGLILIIITAFVLYRIKKMPFLFVGWFWYLGTLIPVIGLVQTGKQGMADRYTYLPSIGIAVMLAWGIPLLIRNKDVRKKIFFPVTIAILSIFATLTWIQCGYWKDSLKIFSHTAQVTNNNYLAYELRGIAYSEKGQFQRAIQDYSKAIQFYEGIQLQHDYSSVFFNRAMAYSSLRQYQPAIEDYNKAILMNSDFAEAYNNRGRIYGQLGQYQLAIDDFNKVIDINPEHEKAYNNRGLAFNALRQYQNAFKDFTTAIKLKPDYANAYNNRALSYLKIGSTELACADAKKACSLGNCLTLQATSLCR